MKIYLMMAVGFMMLGLVLFPARAAVAKPGFKASEIPASWRRVKPRQRLKALRAAQLDAYRALVERIYGFQLESGSTVYNSMLQSDAVKNRVDAVLKGATELGQPEYTDYGMVMVTYGVKLNRIIETVSTEKTSRKTTSTYTRKSSDKVIEALGCGALPGSRGESMLHSRRAAELDAYRQMAERFAGVRINSTTSVRDMCLTNDKVSAAVAVFLKGLKPVAVSYGDDNTCEVKMRLKMREMVKTIESFVKIYNNGSSKRIKEVSIAGQDRIFTVTGHGASGTPLPELKKNNSLYELEQTIFRQVITRKQVID